MIQTASIKRNIRYAALLSNIELLVDATGLVTNTTNSYGQVDGSGNIVQLNSITPGPTGRDFTVQGSGVTFDATTKSIAFNGSGNLRSTGAASLFNFMSFHASGYSSIKWTAFVVCKIGNVIKPSSVLYGLFGNNAGTSANKGAQLNYANTNGTTEDQLSVFASRGTAGQFLGRMLANGDAPSNQYCVITAQFDGSAVGALRMRLYVNDQAILFSEQLNNNSSPVTTPSFAFELGAVGNNALRLVGNIKELVITSTAPTYDTTIAVIRQLMNKHKIVRSTAAGLNTSLVPEIFEQELGVAGANYFICPIVSQNPVSPNIVFVAYSVGDSHVYSAGKKLAGRKSIYKAAPFATTFAAEVGIYDPAGNDAVQDIGGGFDQNGVMHIFSDVMNGTAAGSMVAVRHIYSSDLTSWTNTDITASLASDGLAAWRMYGNMVHANGIWVKAYYKLTDQGDTTQSANYIFRSTDGINWTSVTVRAPAATYINEGSIFYLGGNDWGLLCRNDTTGEWSLSLSSDNAQTWDAFTDVTLSETVASANPPMVKTFTHNGQLVVVAYITNRNNDTAFAVYGLPANIIASRGSGWDLDTKIMWWKTSLAPFHYMYGDVAHLDGTLKAVGVYCYDQFPGSGSGLENKLNFTTMPTWHVSKIESELGL